MNLHFYKPRLSMQYLTLFPRHTQAWVLGEWTSNHQDLPYDWVSQEMSEWSLYILMCQSNTDHHYETLSHLASSSCKEHISNPFFYCCKEKQGGMSIKNCTKSMEFLPITFSEAAFAMTEGIGFSDKTPNCKLQNYLFWRRPYQSHSYCGRKVSKLIECTDLFKII